MGHKSLLYTYWTGCATSLSRIVHYLFCLIDTNIAIDAVYLNLKKHRRTLDFRSDFKSRWVKLSRRVVVEIEETLAESFELLPAKVRDYIKHLERTKRGWNKLDSREPIGY